MNRLLFALGFLLAVGLFFFACNTDAKPGISKNDKTDYRKVPLEFSFQQAEEEVIKLSDLRGKIVFINFWASWCPTCREEMPSLNNLYQKYKRDEKIAFVVVNKDKDTTDARAYLQERNFDLPIFKQASDIPKSVFTGELPTTVLLDKKGRVIYREDKLVDFKHERFAKLLDSLRLQE